MIGENRNDKPNNTGMRVGKRRKKRRRRRRRKRRRRELRTRNFITQG